MQDPAQDSQHTSLPACIREIVTRNLSQLESPGTTARQGPCPRWPVLTSLLCSQDLASISPPLTLRPAQGFEGRAHFTEEEMEPGRWDLLT